MDRKRKRKKKVGQIIEPIEFEWDFLTNLLTELKNLRKYYSIYYDKLRNGKLNWGDKILQEIIYKSIQLKKYLLTVIWKNTIFFKRMYTLKIDSLVSETIVHLHLNIDNIINETGYVAYFYCEEKVSDEDCKDSYFNEKNILIKTTEIIDLLSSKYNKIANVLKSEKYYDDCMKMTFNLIDCLRKTNHLDSVCYKTTPKTVKQISSKFYFTEKANIF